MIEETELNAEQAKKKYFLDTEFIERGSTYPVSLISIGIICEDGRTFYAVSSEFHPADASDWVKDNVLPHIEGVKRSSLSEIARNILIFIGDVNPEFWGYYCDYDWVVFCQIFGTMMDLPKGWPMYCRDIKQLCGDKGNPKLPPQDGTEHDALMDAQWNKLAYEFLVASHSSLPEEKEAGKPEIATPEPMVGAWHLVDAIAEGVDERTRFIAAELMQWRKFGATWNAAKEAKR
jgi:hypothetical protein